MDQFAKETLPVSLEEEMRRSYLDYAMSVIVGRALPDVRDGLKPVHRRVLFAMHELSNDWNKAYKKSARIVGDVIGKYHPHGDTAVYDTIVRMAQDFSLRYPLVDGQGNFGSVDGDNAAAMRYTEIRMSRIAHELLADIDKETVDFGPNYDGSEHEPLILPSKLPNLLVNGSSGIAVGMATNIPPHNLNEVVDACLKLLAEPETGIEELIEIVPAPDFPTAGIIYGTTGVKDGYRTGRGRVVMRARAHFEDIDKNGTRQAIIVDELPYQVNKKNLLEKIAELVREKRLEGISELRDESDKSGMRMVIELKRGENPEVILNNLYKLTQLQDTFGMNMVALVDGQPRLLNLKQMLDAFLRHRREVVTRRTVFELKKARDRGHILEGLAVALSNVDEVIALIKAAPTPAVAKEGLMSRLWHSPLVEEMLKRTAADASRPEWLAADFGLKEQGYRLSDNQAQAILELRLQRLTGLEQDKIVSEYREVMEKIADLLDILAKPARVTEIIVQELNAIKLQYGDKRRSEIIANAQDLSLEDLIAPQDVVVTLSHSGYIKSQPLEDYRAQKRGGRGKQATATKEDDFIEKLFIANTHDYILCFSNRGRVYWIKVYEVPQGSRISRGKPIVNVLQLEDGEKINAILPVKEFDENHYIFMATSNGIVKKTPLSDFSRPTRRGIIAVNLDEGDYLIGVALTDGQHDVMLFSDGGKAVRFDENDVRPMGRVSRGVIGMRLAAGQKVISMLVAGGEHLTVLTATENGFGKRSPIGEYTRHGRGTQGMIAIQTTDRNGKVVAATLVAEDDEIMLITNDGVLIRTRVKEIRIMGRATQGVTLINVDEGGKLVGLERIVEADSDEAGLDINSLKSTVMERIHNFSAGPAMLPQEVLEQARDELPNWQGCGMSVMEMSHRGKEFMGILAQAEADLRDLMGIPANYKVLFLQGGATLQFAQIPLNLLGGRSADYLVTGSWSKKAYKEAQRFGTVRCAGSTESDKFTRWFTPGELNLDPTAAYLHVCTNETIHGVEVHDGSILPDSVPLVADMSSHILSRPIDVSRYALIYAGAQKNIGPAGVTLVIVRDNLIGKAPANIPTLLDYAVQAEHGSMLNTPPTYAIYMAGLVFRWLKRQGGLAAIEKLNVAKADLLYDAIDGSALYRNPVAKADRSRMNIPFTLTREGLDEAFIAEAKKRGIVQIKGHSSVGGMRASIYNAMPLDGVRALTDFMRDFEHSHG